MGILIIAIFSYGDVLTPYQNKVVILTRNFWFHGVDFYIMSGLLMCYFWKVWNLSPVSYPHLSEKAYVTSLFQEGGEAKI